MKMNGIIIAIICTGLILFAILSFIFKPQLQDYKRLKSQQEYRDSTYLSKNGGTCGYYPPNWDVEKDGKYFTYYLRSWDGGKNWYAIKNDFENNEFIVLGEAEDMYPGLIKYLQAWDNLTEYVEKNGPIDGSDPEGVKILEDAGFTVEKTNK